MTKKTIGKKTSSMIGERTYTFEQQPNQLYFLSLLELGERFGHYLLRAIVVLYMVKVLLFTKDRAYGVFAGFSSLLYLSPLLGGLIRVRFDSCCTVYVLRCR
jgi:proton-dependent oligopeptide transporter, POT family